MTGGSIGLGMSIGLGTSIGIGKGIGAGVGSVSNCGGLADIRKSWARKARAIAGDTAKPADSKVFIGGHAPLRGGFQGAHARIAA